MEQVSWSVLIVVHLWICPLETRVPAKNAVLQDCVGYGGKKVEDPVKNK